MKNVCANMKKNCVNWLSRCGLMDIRNLELMFMTVNRQEFAMYLIMGN